MALPPKVSKLEVSPAPSSVDAAWIPLGELEYRSAELPPKEETILLVESGDYQQALQLLQAIGRKVLLVPPMVGGSLSGRLWTPNPFLEECLQAMAPGEALELACGGGREATALAGAGWGVTAVDNLPDGLARAGLLAHNSLPREEADRIGWLERDLVKHGLPKGNWDLITMFFFLDRELLQAIPAALSPGGSLILETFLEEHVRQFGKPKCSARVLKEAELPGLFPQAEIVRYEEGLCRGRITARGWFRFPP